MPPTPRDNDRSERFRRSGEFGQDRPRRSREPFVTWGDPRPSRRSRRDEGQGSADSADGGSDRPSASSAWRDAGGNAAPDGPRRNEGRFGSRPGGREFSGGRGGSGGEFGARPGGSGGFGGAGRDGDRDRGDRGRSFGADRGRNDARSPRGFGGDRDRGARRFGTDGNRERESRGAGPGGRQGSDGFRNDDRPQRGGFGDRDRPQRGGFGDRDRGDRGGFGGDRPQRGGFGDRDRAQRGGFGDQGDRTSFGGDRPHRDGFGDNRGRSFGGGSERYGSRGRDDGDRNQGRPGGRFGGSRFGNDGSRERSSGRDDRPSRWGGTEQRSSGRFESRGPEGRSGGGRFDRAPRDDRDRGDRGARDGGGSRGGFDRGDRNSRSTSGRFDRGQDRPERSDAPREKRRIEPPPPRSAPPKQVRPWETLGWTREPDADVETTTTPAHADSASGEPVRKRDRSRKLPEGVSKELTNAVGAKRGQRLSVELVEASKCFERERFNDALRILRPLLEDAPDVAAVRELIGLCLYRQEKWHEAIRQLDRFVEISGSVEQNPVLADCHRALRNYGRVEALWNELAESSPSADLVMEGRIVMAGALGDQGKLEEAIKLLERAPSGGRRVRAHHVRLWYALADLYERAGDVPRARDMFAKVYAQDPELADVAVRLANLG